MTTATATSRYEYQFKCSVDGHTWWAHKTPERCPKKGCKRRSVVATGFRRIQGLWTCSAKAEHKPGMEDTWWSHLKPKKCAKCKRATVIRAVAA